MNRAIQDGTSRRLFILLVIGLLYGLCAYAGITLTRGEGRIAAIWVPNALLVAVMMRWQQSDVSLVLVAFFANIVADLLAGDPLARAMGLSAANGIEMMVVCRGLRMLGISRPDLLRVFQLAAFCVVGGILAPVVSGAVAMFVLSSGGGIDGRLWVEWVLTDGLGLMIVTPAVWQAIDAWQQRKPIPVARAVEWAGIMGLTAVTTAAVFAQSRFPLLYVASPAVLLAAFRLGGLGAAAATIITAAIALAGTTLGSGPIALVRGDMSDKLHVLQGFLAVNFAMSLPLASALASRFHVMRALAASEARFRRMAEAAPVGIYKADAAGQVTYVNAAWTAKVGLSVAQSLGDGWMAALADTQPYQDDPPWIGFERPGDIKRRQARFRATDGSDLWVEIVNSAEFSDEGALTGFIGVVIDITDQRRNAEALAMREAELRLLADNLSDAVVRLSLDGVCRYASPSSAELFELPAKAMIGINLIAGFHPDDDENVRASFARLGNGEIDRARIAFRSASPHDPARYRWMEANCSLLRDPTNNQPHQIIASLRDVSATKQLEMDLRDARERAEHAAAAQTSFLANMSHEIRTPMNGVLGFADLLLTTPLAPDQRRQIEMIADSGRSMMRLLNDILDIAKVESGEMTIARERYDLWHVANGVARLMEPTARAKGLALGIAIEASVPQWIMGDALRIRQILLNLVGNAIKFTSDGRIDIRIDRLTTTAGDHMRIAVADTGIGIPPDRRSAIFDKFSQADVSTARRFGGSGLGLTISRELAELMSGTLTLESAPGSGSVFKLTTPLEMAEQPAPLDGSPRSMRIRPELGVPVKFSGALKVLIAEDNAINQELMLSIGRLLGFDAVMACDGGEAVRMVLAAQALGAPFDLVLMDMQMPELDGLEATRRIRAAGIGAEELPIIALTANAFADDIDRCLAAGMQHHLSKPVSAILLGEAIASWAPRAARPEASAKTPPAADTEWAMLLAPGSRLHQQFVERRDTTLAAVAALSDQRQINAMATAHLVDMLHKLAGTAGNFGETALGDWARDVERQITDAMPAARGDILRRAQQRAHSLC